MNPSEMLPSLPMTGPQTSEPRPQRRRLGSPAELPQQDGTGESEMDFAVYRPPSYPEALATESRAPIFPVQMARRHLPNALGRRRL